MCLQFQRQLAQQLERNKGRNGNYRARSLGKYWPGGFLTEKRAIEIDQFHTMKNVKMFALKEDHISAWI